MGTSFRSRRSTYSAYFSGVTSSSWQRSDELEQIFEELADVGGTYEVFKMKLADAAAQVDPQVLLVEHAEIFAGHA